MGIIIENSSKYAAFISYAHADEASAKRLHNALETYLLPKGMDAGQRAKLSPIFRDVTELTAHHSLSEKIREAVKTSRFLIVLCSPAAKASHWVNEEIRLFRSLHGEGAILAVIVDGVPDTAFPPALLEDGREPLAADISGKEGFKFGVTQLAASMLGVGLDQLVQRDQRRRRIRTQIISGATTALALIMGALAWNAVDARDEAEVSRNEAEKMVEFMIKDLKEDLDPIGKLEILDGVGERVADYYDAIPISDMDDDRLGRRARARHLLGEVAIDQGKYEHAETELKAAYEATNEILSRHPKDTDAIYNHAQSEYWVGWKRNLEKDFLNSLPNFLEYDELAQKLYQTDPQNFDWVMEAGWGKSNLAIIHFEMEKFETAKTMFLSSIEYFQSAIKLNDNNSMAKLELGNGLAGASNSASKLDEIDEALKYRKRQIDLHDTLVKNNPSNYDFQYRWIQSNFRYILLRKESFCNNPSTAQLIDSIKRLIKHEPKNVTWRREYFLQTKEWILLCSDQTDPTLRITLESFQNELKNFQHDSIINDFSVEIKRFSNSLNSGN